MPMQYKTLRKAIKTAERFIEEAETLKSDRRLIDGEFEVGAQTGTVRRASMDLTRVLADLRQGR